MNEELALAIDRLRKIHYARAWFITILLSECDVPNRDIGGGSTIRDIQWLQLYEDWSTGIEKLLSVIGIQANIPE